MQLDAARAATGGYLRGDDVEFRGVSTDTRTLAPGELFCAIAGPRFDGHAHCAQAAANGAAALMVEREVEASIPTLLVADSRAALGDLAHVWRRQHALRVVGVTGSNGKTTVKEMVASILRQNTSVLATSGNFNNDIGVPRTLFELGPEHSYAVVEMGANHIGEIAALAKIAEPDVGVVTLCAPAHLEGFGSIENVAAAKGEMYSALAASGIAVINADDRFAEYWSGLAGDRRIIRFAMERAADVNARAIRSEGIGFGMAFELSIDAELIPIALPFDGRHNIANALCAAALAHALGIDMAQIKLGLENAEQVGSRLKLMPGLRGAQLIDDTYNANPTSLLAALAVLASADTEKWLVLGDMGELGSQAVEDHQQAGTQAKALGIDRLYTLGELAQSAASAFGPGANHYTTIDALNEDLRATLDANVTVLIKGSRFMRMERVSTALSEVAAC